MFRLADWPIRRKLGFLTGVGTLVALLLACCALTLNDVRMIRAAKVKQITALADILGSNATTSLEFHDPDTAAQVLSSLRLQPSIETAALFDAQGELLASYPTPPSADAAIHVCPDATEARFTEDGFLVIAEEIRRDGDNVGTVYLRGNLEEVGRELANVGWIVLAVLTTSLTAAMLFTDRLQRLFTAPIHELAEAMEHVSAGGDSSLHVQKYGADEMGVLCDGFNRMLDQINSAHDELQQAHDGLEERVVARTKELQAEVAERKLAEEALRVARDAAEAADHAKSELLANMSHEIRTPMTAILGFTDMIMGSVTAPEDLDAAATIRRNGEHLIEIINDILDISKIEAGQLKVENIDCSPCQVLSDLASLMRVRASAKGLALEVEYDGPIPLRIHSDPTRLRQILINLAGNAIKFTEVGTVRVLARILDSDADEPRMQFDVIDTGIGLTEAQVGRLFQPFVQADASTTRKYGGTGLGLTISKRLAEMLGGTIHVDSTPGVGCTFSVTVSTGPLHGVTMVDVAQESVLPTAQVEKPVGTVEQLNCRVLLAEDGPDNQRLISFVLKKAGADVEIAENGQIALDQALAAREAGAPFDVILMDMQMPVLDGYGATGKLREAGYAGPIIALTAHAMSGDREKCLGVGCDDYTTKPIDRLELVGLVGNWALGRESTGLGRPRDSSRSTK